MTEERSISLQRLLHVLSENTHSAACEDCTVTHLAIDSRTALPGCVFVALRGEHTDGHRYVAQAIANGAIGVVTEEPVDVPAHVTSVTVPDTARALSQLADAFFGSPSASMTVAGITGTNGKTTSSLMTAAILNAGGLACGTIGTIGARFGPREWTLEHTTPPATQLQSLLAEMRELGARCVAMEVSSHALALQRVADVRFRVGALTNVTRDHLDFHKNFESYAAAKHKLFEMAQACVLNVDDDMGERWSAELRAYKPTTTYALRAAADLRPEEVDLFADGSRFALQGQRFHVRIPGRFNVANALCAIAIGRHLGVRDAQAARGLEALERVAGRMEHVRAGGIDVIVDYAHTPDALENVLRSVREATGGRLIAVFGCGGDRDRGKRPEMGAVAARYADFTYVTSDNPRREDPMEIIEAILPGIDLAPHEIQVDRRTAIERAIAGARPGDVVVVAGKGHEAYQIVGDDVLPFDDRAVSRDALLQRGAASS